ncbi:HNH endonuclease [Desulfobacula sp.]|uniref:HNH endonuclease n=1 Tax=Desulfobacula sp. TaxID=2593537 RepID=UPI0039B8C7DF
MHEEIIRYFNITVNEPHTTNAYSSSAFQAAVREAYNNECVVTGFSIMFDGKCIGVEASHIFWLQSGGNNEISNAIALNTTYRKLFHLGIFTIDKHYRVRLSSSETKKCQGKNTLLQYDGQVINLPKDEQNWPSQKTLEWHSRWVFRG